MILHIRFVLHWTVSPISTAKVISHEGKAFFSDLHRNVLLRKIEKNFERILKATIVSKMIVDKHHKRILRNKHPENHFYCKPKYSSYEPCIGDYQGSSSFATRSWEVRWEKKLCEKIKKNDGMKRNMTRTLRVAVFAVFAFSCPTVGGWYDPPFCFNLFHRPRSRFPVLFQSSSFPRFSFSLSVSFFSKRIYVHEVQKCIMVYICTSMYVWITLAKHK